MKFFKKLFLIFFACAVLLIGLAIFAVLVLPETDLVRTEVQNKLRDLTGQEVILGSIKISGSFPRLISVTVHDVSVVSRSGQRLLSAQSVVLSPEFAPLLKREISVDSVAIQGLRTSVRRAADGTIVNAFIPVPAASGERSSQPEPPLGPQTASNRPGVPGLTWSVKTIRLDDSTIDWIDSFIVQGTETIASLNHVHAFMNRQESANSFSLNLTGLLDGQDKEKPIALTGNVSLSDDLSGLQRARMTFSSQSLPLAGFYPYLPPWASVAKHVGTLKVDGGIDWEKGKPGKVNFQTECKEPFQLKLSGDATFSRGFSVVEQGSAVCDVGGFRLGLVKELFTPRVPLNFEKATLAATLTGEWKGPEAWHVNGSAKVDRMVPVGVLQNVAGQMHMQISGSLSPERLLIQAADIGDQATVATIAGQVLNPLSDKRLLDLTGEFSAGPQLLKSFGAQLPKEILLKNPIPVRAAMKGRPANPSLDVSADVSAVGIEWQPHFEKTAGSKGTLSIKGKPSSLNDPKDPDHPRVGVKLSSVRLGQHGRALPKAAVQMDASILVANTGLGLKDAVVIVKKTADGGEILRANASAAHVLSADSRIDGTASLTVDRETLSLAGIDSSPDLAINGSSVLKAKFSGSPSSLSWSMELPVNNFDVALQKAFRKPEGVAGLVKASGKWADNTLEITEGHVTLPGLVLAGRGHIVDRTGTFRDADLDVKRLELKDFVRLLPSVSGMGLSGPLDAKIHLKNSGGHVVPSGTINVRGVDVHPPNSSVRLDKITGTLTPAGTSLGCPELKCSLAGALEAPVRIKGSLDNVSDAKAVNGNIAIQGGPGKIKAEVLRKIFRQVQLMGELLGPLMEQENADFLDLRSLSGDISLKSGTAATENLRIKGPAISAGAIGTLRVSTSDLDVTAAVQGATALGSAIGKMSGVQQLMKKHGGLLKATGLDKELKRYGIEVPDGNQKSTETQAASKHTPVTVILKLRGPLSGPQVTPVLESTMDKNSWSKLKSLLE
ncbi:MAG TPA: DUF748 domain-containing protein [Desulfomonilaceae bacterium]|nr:DUF748 domain-containing protein [Desulfomonilaceae bacterium]